jgi:hypothetical protein
MRLFPKDAVGFEKFVYAFGYGIPVVLYLFMQLSAFGVFHNLYSAACKAAGWGWKIPGGLITLILFVEIYTGIKDEKETLSNFALFVVAALSLLFYCGFAYPYIF